MQLVGRVERLERFAGALQAVKQLPLVVNGGERVRVEIEGYLVIHQRAFQITVNELLVDGPDHHPLHFGDAIGQLERLAEKLFSLFRFAEELDLE